jgi:NADH pyrophosphatase NudC (nudix superfamily)
MVELGAVIGAALLGFCVGLWSFKVKSRWCPVCGRPTWPLDQRGRKA